MHRFQHIDTWVFDLDNTLYSADDHVFEAMRGRMHLYISEKFKMSLEEARKLSDHYYHTYGTTLAGLMKEHGEHPDDFLHFVHDLDLTHMTHCPITKEWVDQLPGRKIIYTNAARMHAERILDVLQIKDAFEDIFDIADADYIPKPDPKPYQIFMDKYKIDPKRSCMLEDQAKNLRPAHQLGMTTIWLDQAQGHLQEEHMGDHIHHNATDIQDLILNYIEHEIDLEFARNRG